ncbi:MAG: glycosyltransferase [Candidatus Roizmanbacteria bacterium]
MRKNIRIGIDGGSFVPNNQVASGIQRIIQQFLYTLLHGNYTVSIFFYTTLRNTDKQKSSLITIRKLPQYLFASFHLPIQAKRDNVDVILCFSSYVSPLCKLLQLKTISFIYDFGFILKPELYTNNQRLIRNIDAGIVRANKLILSSYFTEQQLKEYCSQSEEPLYSVLYPGVDHLINISESEPANFISTVPYALFVGKMRESKNLLQLFRVFAGVVENFKGNLHLVLVGDIERDYWISIENEPEYFKIKSRIILTKNVPDSNIVWFIKHAICVMNYSSMEGFAFPVLESLALGAKVFTNDLSLYHEFETMFPQLYIGKTVTEIVDIISKANTRNKEIEKIYPSWEKYTQSIMKLVDSML